MNDNTQCQMKGCIGKLLLSAVCVFIFLFAAGYVEHHILLKPLYEQTASLWRAPEDMQNLFPLIIIRFAVISLLVTLIFFKIKKAKMMAYAANPAAMAECKIGGKHCPIKMGVCFGAIIGALMGASEFKMYFFVSFPNELAAWWFVASVVKGIGMGIILALSCKKQA